MEILSTKHPTILNFFNEHKNIDFESVNLLLVQLLEKILDNNDSVQKSSAEKIFSSINNLYGQFENFKNQQDIKEKNLHQQLVLAVTNIKREHVNEITKYIDNKNELSKHEIKSIIDNITENQNNQIQKNIQLMLLEQFPKDEHILQSLKKMLEDFGDKNKELIQSMDGSSINSYLERLSINYNQLINNYQENIVNKINSVQTTTVSNFDINNKLSNDFQSFINKYQNSSLKGQFGENKLASTLNQCFPTAEVVKTSNINHCCDYLLKRDNEFPIYFENKDYDRNIPPAEIKKFIRDIEEQQGHGIFLSQHSGITSKANYQIDIHKGNILVYLHHVDFNCDKIKLAVDVIDHLSSRLEKIDTNNDNNNTISQEDLDVINNEYQKFINHKENLIQFTRDCHKKLTSQINELEFPSIEKYLNSKFANIQSSDFLCDICGKFRGTSAKSLAAHKRACKLKVNNNFISVETSLN